jgi:hypothetical protein
MRLHTAPLITLTNATAEWHAGAAPSCLLSARLLDQVALQVGRGDCVVVRHADAYAARVLLAALGGSPRLLSARAWMGVRVAAPGLRVRRAAVATAALPALLQGWQQATVVSSTEADGHPATPHGTPARIETPVVHLLRASRSGTLPHAHAREWQRWAAAQRARGGALVIVAATEGVPTAPVRAEHSGRHQTYERGTPYHPDASAVRELLLRHGRLIESREALSDKTDSPPTPASCPATTTCSVP